MIKLSLFYRLLPVLAGPVLIPLWGVGQNPTPTAYPSTVNRSIIRNWDVMIPFTTPNDVNTGNPSSQALLTTKFMDGLGRPLQDVIKGGALSTGSGAVDMVNSYLYDGLGRERYKYLPFAANNTGGNASVNDGQFKLNPFQEQASFYDNANAANPLMGQGETWLYGQTNFEASPMGRPLEGYAAGNNWVGTSGAASPANRHGLKTHYWINTPTDAVRIWTVTDGANFGDLGTYSTVSTYPAGRLAKNVTEDEHGKQLIVFKDTKGRIILRKAQLTAAADDGTGSDHGGWLCTYYIYDDLDNLRCAVQPAGVQLLMANSWDITALSGNILNEQCFRYEYDLLNRAILKKNPGGAAAYMVYDVRNRLVMAQDGNLRANGQWLCYLYDDMDKQVLTGTISYSGSFSSLQNAVTTQTTPSSSPNTTLQVDLTLSTVTTGDYQALRNITLAEGFSTPDGGAFSAQTNAGPGGPTGQTSLVANVLVNLNPIPSGSSLSVLTITHYDDYTGLPAGLSSGLVNSNYAAYLSASTGSPDFAQPITASAQTKGMVTWTQEKVLGTSSQFISSVNIYNEKGNPVQSQRTNVTGGVDVTTNQYNFSGKLLNTHEKHQYLSGAGQTYELATRNTYDDLQRLIKIEKNFNNAGYKTISSMEYDALGQLRTKRLGTDPNNSPNPLEKITYDYNIRGWAIGANRNYLTTEGQTTDGTHFGFELGYDKAAGSTGQNYSNAQFNGNIAGMTWKSDGDDIRRKYDFTYDPANRLFKADFVQQNSDDHLWNNSRVNYTVKMGDGLDMTTAYDANGNILRMQQWGWKTTASAQIDDLLYSYYNNGNKLAAVTDNSAGGTPPTGATGMYLGDFTDKNTSGNDYGYDPNGNLLTDLNKRLNGTTGVDLTSGGAIVYNYLNLPSQVTFKNNDGSPKGTISYVYGATGKKLQKITVEGTTTTTTTYIDGFVYQTLANTADHSHDYTDRLQFVLHEEGRIRYRPLTGALPAAFVYDYFVKDHLDNTRLVLTDEQQLDIYPAATLEGSLTSDGSPNASYYEKNYYTINPSNVVDKSFATGITDYWNKNGGINPTDAPVNNNPNSVVGANSQKLYMLTATGGVGVTGLGISLKVMSGDRIDIFGKSYYFQNNSGTTNYPVPVGDILTGLLGAPTGVAAGHGVALADLNGQTAITTAVNTFATDPNRNNNGTSTTPKAYINWILFDNNFKFVAGNYSRVGSANAVKDHYTTDAAALQNIQVTKNGYLYVYVENESPVSVFFDNLQVLHTHGPLVEESHYYPFGLTMAGISDKALKTNYAENKFRFNKGSELQNKEFSDGSGLEMYSTEFRSLDPQLGRWWQMDPKPHENFSPYTAMKNNPFQFNDPLGDTVRRDGFTDDEATKMLGKIIKANGKDNPFFFKGGILQTDQKKMDKLSDDQKKVASNITKVMESKTNFTIKKVASTDVVAGPLGKGPDGKPLLYHVEGEAKGKEVLTYSDYGNAATTVDKSGNVTVGIVPGAFVSGMNSGLCDKNGNDLANPVWMVLGHELGGHGYYKYVKGEAPLLQKGHAVDYENSIRTLHGGIKEQRPYDNAHPDPNPPPTKN